MLIAFLLTALLHYGESCQPPMPAAYQQNGMPVSVPAPPQYIPTNGVAPLDQTAPIPPPPPPPPVSVSASEDADQLEMINAPERKVKAADRITPYPGYIPPPPAVTFPTLIDNSDVVPQNHVNQQSSNTFRSETPLQLLSETKRDGSCPNELTSMTDFLTCVRRLSTVTLDENNLSCDFEKDSGCRLKSMSSPLSVGNFPSADHYRTFATLASRPQSQQPTGNFVFFIEHRGTDPEDEFIMSTPVTCQKGNGVLKFDYWIIGKQSEILLRVCTQDHLARSCTQTIAYNGPSSSIAIEVVHPNSTNFELEVVASNIINPAVIVYDNIEYKAELCEYEEEDSVVEKSKGSVDTFFEAEEQQLKSAENHNGEKVDEMREGVEDTDRDVIPTRPIRLSPKRKNDIDSLIAELTEDKQQMDMENQDGTTEEGEEDDIPTICKLLNCDFDKDMCTYTNYVNESMGLSPWQVGVQKVGNPHTGVRDGSGFLYVGTDSPSSSKIVNYILESPDLSVDEDFHLSMDIYRRSNDITLQICLDTPFYCPYSISPFEKEGYWKDGETYLIPKGTLKIYLRAIQWRKYKWLAIDNMRVITDKC